MYKKENLQPNRSNAPILFIGEGGIGSKIVAGVARRAIKDDTSNIRFVIMDTDANDIKTVAGGAEIIPIQTSSTRTVSNYLKNDANASQNWFPVNEMLKDKPVSEGAGQIRAISRLALNDIIKDGRIQKLYSAIDDLFLKDGGGLKQAIRVVIASTVAGGTGSGIALETGMLVRHYIKKNYPDAAVMIRGFLVMPGVMDTVIKTQSERDSLRCNGYATIKEINAFMMKGSGFFDIVPELKRYQNLHITIPSATSGTEKISNLPFDFCFLMDRTDSNAGNMTSLPQYIDYAAQSLYEQNIGPMYTKASSVEDNVLKLCIDPNKLGRCRFAGAGASALRYSYEDIRDYIALNWTRASIIGSSADDKLTDKQREELLANSWLQYDKKFAEEYKKWDENPSASSKNEPTRAGVYVSTVESGADASTGNDFSVMLWDKYLNAKFAILADDEAKTIDNVAKHYINSLVDGVKDGQIERTFALKGEEGALGTLEIASSRATNARSTGKDKDGPFVIRLNAIEELEATAASTRFSEIVKSFTKEVFNSKVSTTKEELGEYMLEKFISVNGKPMHPNAVRYLLYKLKNEIEKMDGESTETFSNYDNKKSDITDGEPSNFSVGLNPGRESDLGEMCAACDKIKDWAKFGGAADNCNDKLDDLYAIVQKYFDAVIVKEVCSVASGAVDNLIKVYEEFYKSFENKIPSIEKKKETIVTKLKFNNGDCVRYVLGEKKYLDKLVESVGRPTDSGEEASKLYGKIFESLRNNSYIEARRNVNPLNYETKKDIFDDIIIEYYKDRVEESCDIINVDNILQAIKLEHDVKAAIEISETADSKQEARAEELNSESSIKKHINDLIETCKNLASPSIKTNDNEEAREVNLITCNDALEDGGGIRIDDFIPNALRSASVSRNELRFYRAEYNIMPVQLAKLSAPAYNDVTDEFSVDGENEYEQLSAGDYFSIYQRYMDNVGPDSATSAIITPHVDKRWNAVSSMPELDMNYQRRLMRKIHKAMIYGFMYDRIRLYKTTDENPDEKIYKYLDEEDDTVDFFVTNKTKCDVLFEVLDSLYLDRKAVATIREFVNSVRIKNSEEGFRSYEDIRFFQMLNNLKFRRFVNNKELNECEDIISLFTVVLMYCNTLPAKSKDTAEMKIMVEAIIEMIYTEMSPCTATDEAHVSKVANIIVEQYNLFIENFEKHADVLRRGMFSEQVCEAIYRAICAYFRKNKIESYKDKLKAPTEV